MGEYKQEELVKIVKRENNTKRPYLMVNPLQGKHIPVSPCATMGVFHALAERLKQAFPQERLTIIGFAETATAIGAALSVNCPQVQYYMHTTRETVEGVQAYLYFSEVHSHATEQKLVADPWRDILQSVDRVVFAEDEVTTGNTIINLMQQMKKQFPEAQHCSYGIISILNSMPEETRQQFAQQGIPCLFLQQVKNRDFVQELSTYAYEPERRKPFSREGANIQACWWSLSGKQDPRLGVQPEAYKQACEKLATACVTGLRRQMGPLQGKRVLVLGTEEFMYPALLAAYRMEQMLQDTQVRFHATTRSPILPSSGAGYPLESRYELRSVYEEQRVTYVYNLQAYDVAIWLHDAQMAGGRAIAGLASALSQAGCKNLIIGKWEVS